MEIKIVDNKEYRFNILVMALWLIIFDELNIFRLEVDIKSKN